jgi:hypothetical protein
MKTHYCIYQAGKANIETACFAEDSEVLKSPYSGELFEDMLNELNAKRENGSPEYQILKLDDVMPLIEASQIAKYCGDWVEITEEDWYEKLEVLPPEKWETVRGVNIFRMCEYLTGNITAHFAKLNGKFFARNCSTRETYEELAEQVAAKWFAPSVLTMLRRMVDETSGGGVPCLLTLEHARAAILNEEKKSQTN